MARNSLTGKNNDERTLEELRRLAEEETKNGGGNINPRFFGPVAPGDAENYYPANDAYQKALADYKNKYGTVPGSIRMKTQAASLNQREIYERLLQERADDAYNYAQEKAANHRPLNQRDMAALYANNALTPKAQLSPLKQSQIDKLYMDNMETDAPKTDLQPDSRGGISPYKQKQLDEIYLSGQPNESEYLARQNASTGAAPNTTNTANPVPTATTVQQEQTAMSEEQRRANLAANASYQRMLKYLPQLQKENGYAGLGISEAGKAEAWNDLQTRLAQIAMYYDQAQEEKSAATSQAALNYLSSELDGATSAEEAQAIINRYRGLLTDSDMQLVNAAMGSKNWADLYKQNAATAAQNELYTSLANAGYSAEGGVSFNENKANKDGWWFASKWVPGDGFSVKDASGNKYNVEIAEVYQSGDGKIQDAALQYAVKSADTGDVFKYKNDLYMVRDVVRNGELTRDVYKLKQSGNKTKEFGDLMRLYKQQSELS